MQKAVSFFLWHRPLSSKWRIFFSFCHSTMKGNRDKSIEINSKKLSFIKRKEKEIVRVFCLLIFLSLVKSRGPVVIVVLFRTRWSRFKPSTFQFFISSSIGWWGKNFNSADLKLFCVIIRSVFIFIRPGFKSGFNHWWLEALYYWLQIAILSKHLLAISFKNRSNQAHKLTLSLLCKFFGTNFYTILNYFAENSHKHTHSFTHIMRTIT